MADVNKRKRPLRVYIYVTNKELEEIKLKAKAAGINVCEFGRRALFGAPVMEAPSVGYIELIREVKRVGSNLNQLVHKLNMTGYVHQDELENCIKEIEEVKDMLYRVYIPDEGGG